MEDLGNKPAEVVDAAAEVPAQTVEKVEAVAESLTSAAEQASEAAREAPSRAEHDVLAGVSEALHLLKAELQRANDLREYEQKQVAEATTTATEASQPVAEVVEAPIKYVRRGNRKVKK